MPTYPITIAGVKRELPICPLNENLAIGAFVIFGDPELTTAAAEAMLAKAPAYDYIITAEAKGIPLAHEMARLAGNQKYFIARKKAKAYMSGVFEVKVQSITTAGEQTLVIDTEEARQMEGKRMLLLDDVISTGESMRALETLVERAGGIVAGRMAVLAEGDAAKRDDIITLAPLPLFNPNGTIKG